MITVAPNKPYSATVRLVLHVNGQDHEVAKVAPDRVFLRTPITLPPCDATLSISIDGQITEQSIRLPHGASADSPIVPTIA